METLPPPRRRTPLWAAGLLCAAGFVCAVIRIGPSRDGGAHIETFVGGLLQDREKECRRSDWWFRGPVDAMARAVVADVPNHPHISAMPFNLKLATTVSPFLPKVYTDVTEIVLLETSVREVDLHECRTPLDYLKFMPRLMPDSGTIELKGLEVIGECHLDTSGMFYIGKHRGKALARTFGNLSLTIEFDGFNRSHVTDCTGQFDTSISWPDDAAAFKGKHVYATPPPSPPPAQRRSWYSRWFGGEEGPKARGLPSEPEPEPEPAGWSLEESRDELIDLGIPLAKATLHPPREPCCSRPRAVREPP